jgi:hypothetical protein
MHYLGSPAALHNQFMEKAIRSTNTGKGRVQLYPSWILHQTYTDGVALKIEDSTAEMGIYQKEYCNPVSRIIGNFYMGINKTAMPVKMFSNEKEAMAWLKTFLPE